MNASKNQILEIFFEILFNFNNQFFFSFYLKVNNHNLGVEEINLISRSGSGSVYTSQHPSYMSHGNGYQPRKQNGQGLVHNSSFSSLKRGGVNGAASSKSSSDSNNKITRMLLLMSFSYAVLNLPYFISWCMFFYHIGFQSASNTLKYYLFSAINLSEIFYVLNYGVHFFIYCASGKKFRQLLRSAFASKQSIITEVNNSTRIFKIFSISTNNNNNKNNRKNKREDLKMRFSERFSSVKLLVRFLDF